MNPSNATMARLRRLAELLTFPTSLTAAAALMKVPESTCRRWMSRWPEEWRACLDDARAEHEACAQDEALRELRARLKSEDADERYRALKIIAETIGLPDRDEPPPPPPPAERPKPYQWNPNPELWGKLPEDRWPDYKPATNP